MFIVQMQGQMGNQMFQYAFARALAHKKHMVWLLSRRSSDSPYKLGYFELDRITRFIYDHPKITKQYRRATRRLVKYILKPKEISNYKEPELLKEQPRWAYYLGYYQSDSYFEDCKGIIKKSFKIKKAYRGEFERKYGEFFKQNKTIVVHVRRTDYKLVEFEGMGGVDVSLPIDYYKKAFSLIPNIDEYKILFISDDIESVKRDFGEQENYYFEKNEQIVDFQLIQHADIAIIANSTFAWWAAYLSQNDTSRVLAPKYWLGFKVNKIYPVGIETSKFEWIEF